MELIDDLKKREEIISLVGALQEARIVTLTKLLAETQKATPTKKGFILSNDGISFLKDYKSLVNHIEEGVDFLCAINEKLRLPPFPLIKQFKKLIQDDRKLLASLGVRP